MPIGPYEIRPGQVAALTEHDQVALFNLLIRHEARRLSIPPENIHTNLRIHDPDGGVDALTDGSNHVSRWIPQDEHVWQFKRTFPGSLPALARDIEQSGHAVLDAFKRGAGYTLVSGDEMVPALQHARQGRLRRTLEGMGCTGAVRLFSCAQMSEWCSLVPAAGFSFHPSVREYFPAATVLLEPSHAVIWNPDEAREELRQALATNLLGEDAISWYARIEGRPGVGKTRFVLEALQSSDLLDQALYIEGMPSQELFVWVTSEPDAFVTLVADEIEDGEAIRLEEWASRSTGRVQLLTVGPGRSNGANVYSLDPLSEEAVARVVEATARLRPEQTRWIAERTRGFVKLAVAVARAIASGDVNISALRSNREIRSVLARLILPAAGEDSQIALRTVSLFSRLGWRDELAAEGEAAARFMGLEWNRMQALLQPAIDEGLVFARGRYWYVSPDLLAIWLAADVWGNQTHRIAELSATLPSQQCREAFLRRLGTLDVPEVRDAMEALMGDDGPFGTIDQLDDGESSQLLSTIAAAAPDAASNLLAHVLSGPGHARLLEFRRGRRSVIWTLEALAERGATFASAASSLLLLAAAENETYGNNATGVWSALFLTFLANTEVPALRRLPSLDEALVSTAPEVRLVGLRGVARGLEGQEVGLPSPSHPASPPGRWRPSTWEEAREYKAELLSRLDDALTSDELTVRSAAVDVLVQSSRSLVDIDMTSMVLDLFQKLEPASVEERRKLWEACQLILEYHTDRLSPEHRSSLNRISDSLYGSSFADRLVRYVGPWTAADDWLSSAPYDAAVNELSEEILANPDILRPHLHWLFSGEAERVWNLAMQLGRTDSSRTLIPILLAAARDGEDPRLLSGYLKARAEEGEADVVEGLLREWADESDLSRAVFDATLRLPASEAAGERLLNFVDTGRLPASLLAWGRFGRWLSGLPTSVLTAILDRLMDDGTSGSVEAALDTVLDKLESAEGDAYWVAEAQRRLADPRSWGHETMVAFTWGKLAQALASLDSRKTARLILEVFVKGGPRAHDDARLEALAAAARADPESVWPELCGAITSESVTLPLTWELGRANIVAEFPTELVQEWIRSANENELEALAGIVDPEVEALWSVVRALIERSPSVGDELAANFLSGSWVGPHSSYLAKKLERLEELASGGGPEMQAWQSRIRSALQADLARTRVLEEEEDLGS
ncbi:MAG: hypothetical protein ACJ77A_06840 [Actinomycetota bacterium]